MSLDINGMFYAQNLMGAIKKKGTKRKESYKNKKKTRKKKKKKSK